MNIEASVFMSRLFLGGLLLFVHMTTMAGKSENEIPMYAGEVIEIDSYDTVSQTYEVNSIKYPGQGPLIVTPQNLAKSVTAVDLKKILKDPKSIVQNQYKTDKTMMLLPPSLVEERKNKLKSKPFSREKVVKTKSP